MAAQPVDEAGPVLRARGLTKRFPGVVALAEVDLSLAPGRVHALLGENGAGKSTLVRILTGNETPDAGELVVDGAPVRLGDPRQAMGYGLTAVYQELTVLPEMSVADNVMLGQERTRRGLLRRGEHERAVRLALARVGLGDLDPRARCGTLSAAVQQLVEIARALVRRSRVVVLDEPSALLSGDRLRALHEVVRQLAADGVAVVYITHRLEEVRALADEVTVLRDGRVVSSGDAGDYPVARIVREMVGRAVETVFPPLPPPGAEEVLRVRGLAPPGGSGSGGPGGSGGSGGSGPSLDLTVRAGEIIGVAGLLGSGRSRLLRMLAGVLPRAAGEVSVGGRRLGPSLPAAVAAGMVLVPEERKTEGLVLDLPVRANVTLASLPAVTGRAGWLAPDRERAAFAAERARLDIRGSGPDQETRQLSGGNQQKIVLAKWLRTRPRVLLLDEPTRGIDVGAKAEIYRIIVELAAAGLAVVFVSSELPEVVGLAHRVLVCRGGAIVGELAGDQIDEEHIMHLSLGTRETSAHTPTGEAPAEQVPTDEASTDEAPS